MSTLACTVPAASVHTPRTEPLGSKISDTNAQVENMVQTVELALAQCRIDQKNTVLVTDASDDRTEESPPVHYCSICTENFASKSAAVVEGCGHSCCRDCMRGIILAKIGERRYPIPCPFCMIDEDTPIPFGIRGTIQAGLMETVGISGELFQIFTEMQMAEHSVLISCRKCSGSAFVDRRDYDQIEVVACPIAGCTNSWCKQCNQTIECQAKHSCDGSVELASLMSQHGWKHCPGCHASIEKIDGCNHMSCKTPGCNAHFCYYCDALISRGGTTAEIGAAKTAHYRSCAIR